MDPSQRLHSGVVKVNLKHIHHIILVFSQRTLLPLLLNWITMYLFVINMDWIRLYLSNQINTIIYDSISNSISIINYSKLNRRENNMANQISE